MIQKMKKIGYGIAASAMMSAPLAAFAQWNPSNYSGSGLSNTSVTTLIVNIMKWLLYLLGFIAIIGFVIAGVLYLTAYGDDGQIKKAKTAMLFSIVGVLVALIGFIIVTAVTNFLGGGTTSI